MKIKTTRGFTLIELLVVIAIIGILSSVVLASLGTARNKGKDTAVKAALNSLRSQMEITADGAGYGAPTGATGVGANSACGFGTFANAAMTPIKNNIAANSSATALVCSADSATAATKWSAAVALPSASGSFCVDSSGAATSSLYTSVSVSVQNNGACL